MKLMMHACSLSFLSTEFGGGIRVGFRPQCQVKAGKSKLHRNSSVGNHKQTFV